MTRHGPVLATMLMPAGDGPVMSPDAARFLGDEPQIQHERGEKHADNSLSHAPRLTQTLGNGRTGIVRGVPLRDLPSSPRAGIICFHVAPFPRTTHAPTTRSGSWLWRR